MKIIYDIQEWQSHRQKLETNLQIGFVPTMGCLHEGHLSLIKNSIKNNEKTFSSIFVNPIQFNDPKDYENYPRLLEKDLALLKKLKVDFVLIPTKEDLYLDNLFNIVSAHPFSKILEGKYRPGHFNGVLTVVLKLLLLIKSHNAYFGEKDYQQYSLISEMVKSYFIETNIVACSTARDKHGLPGSSRNNNLSTSDKEIAKKFAKIFHSNINMDIKEVQQKLLDEGIHIEYLQKIHNRIFVAVKIGNTRLIDNIIVGEEDAYH